MARRNSSGSTSRTGAKTDAIASLTQTSIGPSSASARSAAASTCRVGDVRRIATARPPAARDLAARALEPVLAAASSATRAPRAPKRAPRPGPRPRGAGDDNGSHADQLPGRVPSYAGASARRSSAGMIGYRRAPYRSRTQCRRRRWSATRPRASTARLRYKTRNPGNPPLLLMPGAGETPHQSASPSCQSTPASIATRRGVASYSILRSLREQLAKAHTTVMFPRQQLLLGEGIVRAHVVMDLTRRLFSSAAPETRRASGQETCRTGPRAGSSPSASAMISAPMTCSARLFTRARRVSGAAGEKRRRARSMTT